MERLVVRSYLYPAFISHTSETLTFTDQFAFRPTGSTTAALIWILYTIAQLLSQHDYVIVLARDFGKAFYSVRHSTLFDKLARLYIPDHVYNWLAEYFQGHSHCTKYENNTSALADISASIIHGSAIGPASYVVHASDLVSITAGNSLCKYADERMSLYPLQFRAPLNWIISRPGPTTITFISIALNV